MLFEILSERQGYLRTLNRLVTRYDLRFKRIPLTAVLRIQLGSVQGGHI